MQRHHSSPGRPRWLIGAIWAGLVVCSGVVSVAVWLAGSTPLSVWGALEALSAVAVLVVARILFDQGGR